MLNLILSIAHTNGEVSSLSLPWNDRIDIFGAPGGKFIMHDSFSAAEKSTVSPLVFLAYQINICLYAFSLAQDPQIIVLTLLRPVGAAAMRTFLSFDGQSAPGNAPRAGRFTSAL